jgi:hypothetical protein
MALACLPTASVQIWPICVQQLADPLHTANRPRDNELIPG